MKKQIAIGLQSFDKIIENHYFYIDKTMLIKEWYEYGDDVTLITRPRRFGKTLAMSMMNCFFSNKYFDRKDLFDGLEISEYPNIMQLQGTYPVIYISFADVKGDTYHKLLSGISSSIRKVFREYDSLIYDASVLNVNRQYISAIIAEKKSDSGEIIPLPETTLVGSLNRLCEILFHYYKKKPLIFLDEYDTPLQEAYINGFWDKAVSLIRIMFNSTFKTNSFLDRAVLTGITRVSKESIFSDLNNLEVSSVTSIKYEDKFGFTASEIEPALKEYGLEEMSEKVADWYDGFVFGGIQHIYNPWSITNYLAKKAFNNYWANSSSNSLVSSLVREGGSEIKTQFESLIDKKILTCEIDEEIVFGQLQEKKNAVWSLLLSTGYLKALSVNNGIYELKLTNREVENTFKNMVSEWFSQAGTSYKGFVKHLIEGNLEEMNDYLQSVSLSVFSSFDTAKDESKKKPENFYHGLVLGLIVELQGRYSIHSNGESGFGRYDITLEPLNDSDPGIIIEFKVFSSKYEKTLEETVKRALLQIEKYHYDRFLLDKHIPTERIRKYGFAFRGKEVLIGEATI